MALQCHLTFISKAIKINFAYAIVAERLAENEVMDLLRQYGIPIPKYQLLENEQGLNELKIGFPLVLKVCSKNIMHKTEVNGVKLGITNMDELAKSFREFRQRFPNEKFIVEEEKDKGMEIIAGLIEDQTFGRCIMVGIGGIFAEIYKDISFRVLPIEKNDVEEMLSELKGKRIFDRFRNIEFDKGALIDLLLKLSKIGIDFDVKEMDLNPIFVYGRGLVVVDAKLILG
jgi:acyl-CoA synthetase (NDP forming)